MCGVRLTLLAAPPWITALMKIPRSVVTPSLVDVLPLTLIPRPADPVSLRGISNVISCFSELTSLVCIAVDEGSGGLKQRTLKAIYTKYVVISATEMDVSITWGRVH